MSPDDALPGEIVRDVEQLLAESPHGAEALDRLARWVAPSWPVEQRDELLRGVDDAVMLAGLPQQVPCVFSPRDARLAAKLEAMFGDRDVADFWSAVAAAIVRAERPLRLPRGKSRSTPWALLLRPIDDLLPPVFVEWFRATAHRRAEAALCDDEPECEEDSSCDVANLDTLDALDEIATEDERAWRGARFLARLGRRRSAGLRMYVELLLLGQLDCLSTEEIATVVSRECGERVTPDLIRKYRARLTDTALLLDP